MAEEISLRERVSQEVSQGFSYVTGTVSRHVSDVVGDELGPLVEDIQSLASGLTSFFSAGMTGIQSLIPGLGKDPQEEVLDESQKQTKLLDKIWGYFDWRRKKDARTFDDKDDDSGGIINAIVRGLAQGLAAGGMIGMFSGLGAGIGSLFASGLGLFGTGGLIFLLGKMIYDGITGWLKGETLIDKSILAGTGILSLPGKILEWVTNAVLWSLGSDFRVDFSEEKIEQGLRNINNWLFDNFTKPIFIDFPNKLDEWYDKYIPKPIQYGLESAVKDIGDKLKWPAKILKDSLSYIKNLLTGDLRGAERDTRNITNNLINMGKDMFKSMGNWLMNNTPIGDTINGLIKVKDFFTKEREGGESILNNLINMGKDMFKSMGNWLMNNTPIGDTINGLVKVKNFLTDKWSNNEPIFDKLISDIKNITSKITEFFKNLIPSWDDIKGAISKFVPDTRMGILGLDHKQIPDGDSPKKDVENKKRSNSIIGSVDTEKIRYENESRKKQEQRDKENTEQLKQAKEDMIRRDQQNMNTISMFQANSNQNVQQRSSKDESPEEVESAIMTIMNNSSFGL